MKEAKKYYAVSRDLDGAPAFYMDDVKCFPEDDWVRETGEGVITDVEVMHTWEDERGRTCALVRGTVVETEEFDFDSELSDQVTDVIVLGNNVLVSLGEWEKNGYRKKYVIKLKGGETVPVQTYFYRVYPGYFDVRQQYLAKVMKYLVKVNGKISYERAHEVCINRFKEKNLDCSEWVKVVEDGMFHVFYPGAYKDSCDNFMVLKDGNLKCIIFGRELEKDNKNAWTIRLVDIQEEMAKYGISAGEDSGDAVEGVTEEERKLLTTHRLASGAVIVQLKAETFRYEHLKNKHLMSKVDKGLGKWLYRLGEPNDFYTWID